jgi:hypothetical protein
MFINSDFSDLLKLFNDNNVKYLGLAAKLASGRPQDLLDAELLAGAND